MLPYDYMKEYIEMTNFVISILLPALKIALIFYVYNIVHDVYIIIRKLRESSEDTPPKRRK